MDNLLFSVVLCKYALLLRRAIVEVEDKLPDDMKEVEEKRSICGMLVGGNKYYPVMGGLWSLVDELENDACILGYVNV